MNKRTVYLAGKITGDSDYKRKFAYAAELLATAGLIVINPAMLPGEGFSYEAYISMSSAMLDECEEVCFLSDWTESRGAMYEYGRAAAKGKTIFFFDEFEKRFVENALAADTEQYIHIGEAND